MRRNFTLLLLIPLIVASTSTFADELPPIPPITRLLPPPGIEVPDDVRKELAAKLAALTPRIEKLTANQYRPDVEVFTKAVAFALRFAEFYDKKDFDKARWALKQAEERLALAEQGEAPWRQQTGLVVRGYRSSIDDSVQPYGLVIPEKHDFSKPSPLYVWLHGRGDKETDLHFVYSRARNKGDIVPENAIVLHAFGRQCVGFKSAGEIDVLEAVTDAQRSLSIKPRQSLLVGFSMGGAGAWHIGAHYPQAWLGVSPGAGFVDVRRYQKLKPDQLPPKYEQALWGCYDVPAYTRNLFNLPVIAYSGELDAQKQAADIMAEAFMAEGRTLPHLIGPKTAHKYHPDSKVELLRQLDGIVKDAVRLEPSEPIAQHAYLQTRTLRYHIGGWLNAWGLKEHWQDARLDGEYKNGKYTITSKNITRFQIMLRGADLPRTYVIDGQTIEHVNEDMDLAHFELIDGKWTATTAFGLRDDDGRRSKLPALQGPIDDAFLEPFLVVLPSKRAAHPRVQQWIEFEIAHLKNRWSALFRGELRIKQDVDVTADDLRNYHIVCFGDAESNAVIRRTLVELPLRWNSEELVMSGHKYDAKTHVPVLIYPNPLSYRKYIVLNSGPTFREAHDRTNSLQNPKLPDWTIIDITTPPDGEKPGKVVAADFFDEQWQIKEMKSQ